MALLVRVHNVVKIVNLRSMIPSASSFKILVSYYTNLKSRGDQCPLKGKTADSVLLFEAHILFLIGYHKR